MKEFTTRSWMTTHLAPLDDNKVRRGYDETIAFETGFIDYSVHQQNNDWNNKACIRE